MKRKASAIWTGDLKSGEGKLSGPSGALSDTPYSFKTRFEEGVTGTNPEELIAAAHAGCFSMAFSNQLASAGHVPQKVATEATLTMEPVNGAPTITAIHLKVQATVPGIERKDFDRIAKGAKENCVVSRVLNATITMDASLD